ncbi:uncharacterized protein C2845_PM06G18160 [Panicum miliaceum]|uniref:Uncharacterized protein n=1 Tax=Panicum miliaceum TaxID=4540 RepID=A0A3L6RCI7_PANMI|nr:uncharacterized protein C2845_PM06G18160 [Panicum miliaceum]
MSCFLFSAGLLYEVDKLSGMTLARSESKCVVTLSIPNPQEVFVRGWGRRCRVKRKTPAALTASARPSLRPFQRMRGCRSPVGAGG